jgi:hypothetical protein
MNQMNLLKGGNGEGCRSTKKSDGQDESEKACESWQMNVDIVQNVQSSGIWLLGLLNNWIPKD